MKRLAVLVAASVFILSGCERQTYDEFVFPEQEKTPLVKISEDLFTHSDYSNIPPVTEDTEETFISSDGLCVIEKKADYMEIFLDTESQGHYNAGRAYGEALIKAMPDYASKMELFIDGQLTTGYKTGDKDLDFVDELVMRINGNISEDLRQEIKGFSDSFGNGYKGISVDNGISYEEALVISMETDVIPKWQTSSSLTVTKSRSATGKPITAVVTNRNKNDINNIRCFNAVMHIGSNRKSYTLIGTAGSFTSDIAVNSSGLTAVIHPYNNSISTDLIHNSLSCTAREILEKYSTAEEAAGELTGLDWDDVSANLVITDNTDCLCAEFSDKGVMIRDNYSELHDGLEWHNSDCLCAVSFPVMKGQDDNIASSSTNITKWQKYDEMLTKYDKLTADDMKSLVTCNKISKTYNTINFRSDRNYRIVILDSLDNSIQASFTGIDGPEDIPDFIMIRNSYGKQ